MAKYGGVNFPFLGNTTTQSLDRTVTINDTIAAAIRCFIITRPGQRRGNPIGSFVTSLKHQLIPERSLEGISEDVKQELIDQFPGVVFELVSLFMTVEDNASSLNIRITFSTPMTELYELNLLL